MCVKSLSFAEWGNTMIIEPMAHWWKPAAFAVLWPGCRWRLSWKKRSLIEKINCVDSSSMCVTLRKNGVIFVTKCVSWVQRVKLFVNKCVCVCVRAHEKKRADVTIYQNKHHQNISFLPTPLIRQSRFSPALFTLMSLQRHTHTHTHTGERKAHIIPQMYQSLTGKVHNSHLQEKHWWHYGT